ncbi:MAG: hypothetical protein HWD86_05385 [Kangiellaceae bacterium]|nr:hypothetical protein [Kangiellaceae bacterium]
MSKSKIITVLVFVGISLLPVQNILRLLVVEIIGGPLKYFLGSFEQLFFTDKPYYNYLGGIVVMVIAVIFVLLLWILIERITTKRN